MAAAQPSQGLGVVPPRGSLYVGDLPVDLQNPESTLYDLFSKVGMVVSIKVCRDINTQRSLGYAYVNFQNPQDAERAIETLNFHQIRPGRQIRIMYSQRDPQQRKNGAGNIFIKNLDASIDNRALCDTFSVFGHILSCKVAVDETGASKGYGFVHFEAEESAKEAINRVDGMLLNGKAVNVCPFMKYQDRIQQGEKNFTNVFVKGFGTDVGEEDFRTIAQKHGPVTSVFISTHPEHQTKFGLVSFEHHDDAVSFINTVNGKPVEGITAADGSLFACRALKKRDRLSQIRINRQGRIDEKLLSTQGRNIYIKHLDDNVTEEQLKELFSQFGTITSAALNKDANGNSRGFGFVCFETKDQASAAIREMNGKMVFKRPLYVSVAQPKDQRIRMLEEQRKAMANRHQMFMNQQNAMGPPGFGWGMGYPPYAMMGRPPLGAPGAFQGNAFPGGNVMMQRTMMPRPQMARPPQQPPRPAVPYQAVAKMPGPMPQRYTQPAPVSSQRVAQSLGGISSADLSNMTPEEQKNALGERLYMKISEIRPNQAAKITGMLLEMDTTEILNVLEDNNTLRAKIDEAVAVLKQHSDAQGN